MSRQTPNQRSKPVFKDHDGSWAKVMDDIDWIMDRFTWAARKGLGRSVGRVGKPFTPGFRWVVNGEFLGRSAQDFLEEIFPGILEAAAVAFDRHDPGRTKVHTYVERAITNQFATEIDYWRTTSSRQVEDGASWELHLIAPIDDGSEQYLMRVNGIDEDGDERLAMLDPHDQEPDVLRSSVQGIVKDVRETLTEQEFEALERLADGQPLSQISEDMGLRAKWEAQRLVDRALAKARKAGDA